MFANITKRDNNTNNASNTGIISKPNEGGTAAKIYAKLLNKSTNNINKNKKDITNLMGVNKSNYNSQGEISQKNKSDISEQKKSPCKIIKIEK